MGGDYHSTREVLPNDNSENVSGIPAYGSKKISNTEIELLLKKGILGLLEEDGE